MIKYLLYFVIYIVAFSASSGERGYYLFVWGDSSGKEYFKRYVAGCVIYAANSQCWNERAGNRIKEVYINTYPAGITDALINSFLSGDNESASNIITLLRNFNDEQISHGFDGMLIINKNNEKVDILTVPLVRGGGFT